MCLAKTPNAPTPPPIAPEAPTMPNSSNGASQADADKRRRLAASNSSTILTGSRGVTENAAVATKTLLGQ